MAAIFQNRGKAAISGLISVVTAVDPDPVARISSVERQS
jgi:hypothetical protein